MRQFPPQWNKRVGSDTSKRERIFYDEEPTPSDVEREPDYFKIRTEEFAKELGRIAARDHMNQKKREAFSIPSPHYADQMSAGIRSNTYTEDANEIFGFRGYTCDNCLTVGTLRVRFGEVGQGVGTREGVHSCDPARVVQSKGLAGKTRSNPFLHTRVPHLVKGMVSNWTGNNPFLVAIRLGNPVEEKLTLFSSSTIENKVITFQLSREKHFDITLTYHNLENHRHILRAIGSGKTSLDDWELTNIIEMMNGVTFGTVTIYYERTMVGLNKTPQHRPPHQDSDSYFLYITGYSALDKVKEGWQHDPLADFKAFIGADVLYPRPFS
jgi:hypothetical protein